MITLPPDFEKDIQGQNLNLYPIVTIDTLVPDPLSSYDSGIDLAQYTMDEQYTGFYHDGSADDFSVGDYVKIEDEYMMVTGVWFNESVELHVAWVTRGLLGSDRVEHPAFSDIYFVPKGKHYFSTKSVTLSDTHYKPLLLNIPSVKESMDFENRNYKISNVTLKFSNYEYEGERFSDYVGNLMNLGATISWVSQSESILEVYNGLVRRYSHDDDTCTLQLEDSTQKDLHADVPMEKLGDDDTVPDKYKLKPYPMVYGEVDYSPCIGTYYTGQFDVEVMKNMTFYGDNDTSPMINSISAFIEDEYYKVWTINMDNNTQQYEILGNLFNLLNLSELGVDTGDEYSTGTLVTKRKCVKIYVMDSDWDWGNVGDWLGISGTVSAVGGVFDVENVFDNDLTNYCQGTGLLTVSSLTTYDILHGVLEFSPEPPGYAQIQDLYDEGQGTGTNSWKFYGDGDDNSPGLGFSVFPHPNTATAPWNGDPPNHYHSEGANPVWSPQKITWGLTFGDHVNRAGIRFTPDHDSSDGGEAIYGRFQLAKPVLECWFGVENFHKLDFYANINGRNAAVYESIET